MQQKGRMKLKKIGYVYENDKDIYFKFSKENIFKYLDEKLNILV